jgi:hypothetical protein
MSIIARLEYNNGDIDAKDYSIVPRLSEGNEGVLLIVA